MRSKKRRIYYRYTQGSDVDITRGLPYVLPSKELWDAKKQEVKAGELATSINPTLREFKAEVNTAEEMALATGILINEEWAEKIAAKYFSQVRPKTRNTSFLGQFIEEYIETLDVSSGTLKSHNTILKRYLAFEEYQGRKYRVREFGPDQAKDFAAFLYGYAEKTKGKTIKTLREYLGQAAKTQPAHRDYTDITYKEKETTVKEQYFTEAEVKMLTKKRYSNWRAQKLFLVGLRTGLRIEDLMRINNTNTFYHKGEPLDPPRIENGNLVLITKKTGSYCCIPLHPDIIDLIEELEPMLHQKFNYAIKNIAREMGLTGKVYGAKVVLEDGIKRRKEGYYPRFALVRSHLQRRTYITLRKEEGDTEEAVAAATGHKIKGQVAGYNQKTPEQYAEEKKKQWTNKN